MDQRRRDSGHGHARRERGRRAERLCAADREAAAVIYMGDAGVFRGRTRRNEAAYAECKRDVHSLMREHAKALAPNVRVNEVVVGHVHGNDAISPRHMLGRKALARDVVSAIEFLLQATSVTGQSLCVDDT